MKLLYNKNHLHVSVGTALLIGVALGIWLGARAGEARLLECAIVLVGFIAVSHISMSLVDKRYLPVISDSED